MFSRWQNNNAVCDAVGNLSQLSAKHKELSLSDNKDEISKAHKIWRDMAECYWEILFAILDAKLEKMPANINFDEEERLFIDVGYLNGVLDINKDFDADKFLNSKAHGGIFPVMTFSDYISYQWSLIMGAEPLKSPIGDDLEGRIKTLTEDLEKIQTDRDNMLLKISESYTNQFNLRQGISALDKNLMSMLKYLMRVPEYREGSESFRQQIANERKYYNDAESAVMILISSAQTASENPLPSFEAERLKNIHELTKVLGRKILYAQIDKRKMKRNADKIKEDCRGLTPGMKRGVLREMLTKKREYMAVPAKNARCDQTLLCQPDDMPIDYAKNAAMLEKLSADDIEMFNGPRVRMYGIPKVIFIPGQGLGTYDWLDNSLLIPVFPLGGEEKSLAYALGTFRWDSDEDLKLRTPYGQIKDYRNLSTIAMAQASYRDYSIYMTREKAGYRVLASNVHKVFDQILKYRPEE